MILYKPTDEHIWTGREASKDLYVYQKVEQIDLEIQNIPITASNSFVFLGYECDEGVKRNGGRPGSKEGPQAARSQLAKLPHHLNESTAVYDAGNVVCLGDDMEKAQSVLAEKVTQILNNKGMPLLLGGGHDIAYGHFNGIKKYIERGQKIGIINLDAHFDLRSNENSNNSGTPFYQIANDCKDANLDFSYLCLGIRNDANDSILFQRAREWDVKYIEAELFHKENTSYVINKINEFCKDVDFIYLTIDLDGFSSAFAPGVSAASPMGFSVDIALVAIHTIISTNKLVSADVAELNPSYDRDDQTAKLAASLLHFIMHKVALL
ncbi:formimidoylglutamase [uncultured Eudoraea sp.]|uniref:formimidoylglutamase n=1 Tax=uncultured Eudoraea sp. TaxID=1035614 RepID=UPI00262B4E1D|nr:formimidoylglutamase [uncultured Eudoraea sp.]